MVLTKKQLRLGLTLMPQFLALSGFFLERKTLELNFRDWP